MNRFYVDATQLDRQAMTAYIDDKDEIAHITRSLRLEVNDKIELSGGEAMNYLAQIAHLDKNEIHLTLLEQLKDRELPLKIDLFQGIPKGQKWDYLIQKAVECGVNSIYPMQLKRCVSIIKEKSEQKKRLRWQKIADEAAKQSKRSYRPKVHHVMLLEEAISLTDEYDLVLIAYEDEVKTYLKAWEHQVKCAKNIAIWIGPEGGFEESEVQALCEKGISISLGKRILRTESAAMVLLSQIGYIVEP